MYFHPRDITPFIVLGLLLYLLVPAVSADVYGSEGKVKLTIFYKPGCSHCEEEMAWLESVKPVHPELVVEAYNIYTDWDMFQETCDKYNTSASSVPRTFVNGKVFAGFKNEEGPLEYDASNGVKAFMGYRNQIEDAIHLVDKFKLILFYSPTCPHCKEERKWLEEEIKPNYPELVIEEYDVTENTDLYEHMAAEYNTTTGAVPRTFINQRVFVGFSREEGERTYNPSLKAYVGYSNQIEASIMECLNKTCTVYATDVLEIAKNHSMAKAFLESSSYVVSSTDHVNDTYIVSFWSLESLFLYTDYPAIAIYVDAETGEIIKSVTPTAAIPGVNKPVQGWVFTSMLLVLAAYSVLFLLLRTRVSLAQRYYFAGFVAIIIIFSFIFFTTTSTSMIKGFAGSFPFPVFVFIIALADGFNPCAFTVLIVLLSLLTHTKSRKKMLLIGSLFIVTSALMYFLFIMVINLVGSWVFAKYGSTLFQALGVILLLAGLVNVKDYFYFGKGVSLSISDENKKKVFKRAGKIVKMLDRARDKTALISALFMTVVLAVLVNLVELGCTAMLPVVYTSALISNHGESIQAAHVIYTVFYSLVYVIPLFAILGNFLYTFKSERLQESQGRFLKLAGGLILLVLGLVMLLKPELLTLLR